ncbi:MAG: protein kinase domain-containing protein [Pirellulales bacterium]
MTAAVCPNREDLANYTAGRLSDEASAALAEHFEACPDCQASLATLEDADDTLVARLRRPALADPCLEESQCEAALVRARAIAGRQGGQARARLPLPSDLGEYRLLEELGHGGMGAVYRAMHTKLDRQVAIKVLAGCREEDDRAIARFEREMKAIGQLDHPNIVQAYDAREISGKPVLIMEYVEGLDLGELARRHGPIGTSDACELVRQAALGLEYAHEHGLVHRDVKPSNLMLTGQGQVKLLDLGLARFCHESAATGEITGTGQTMGTADYMAPEQVSDSRAADIRADLYSLGCTLYKLLAGRAPFDDAAHKTTFDKLTAHVREPIPPIRQFRADLPEALVAVLDRLLAKAPDQRFATPGEVAEAIAPFCAGCDLAALAAEGGNRGQGSGVRDQESAAMGRNHPAPATSRGSGWRGRYIVPLVAGLMLFSFGAGLALGIIIRIRKDGQETTFDVPEGSHTRIGADGQLDVELPGGAKAAATANVQDAKAIQGTWEIVSSTFGLIRKLPRDGVTDIDVLKSTRVVITADALKIVGQDVTNFAFEYRLNPDAKNKMIDLQTPGSIMGMVAYGIYQLEGDRLKICTSDLCRLGCGAKSPDAPAPRPSEFWAEFGSGKELLVLRRVGEAVATVDERALLGTWRIEDAPDGGDPLGFVRNQQIRFSRVGVSVSVGGNASSQLEYGYALDPAAEPKRIDIATRTCPPVEPLHGVYELAGDRLTIGWAMPPGVPQGIADTLPPSRLASGPGTALVVLRRVPEDATTKNDTAEPPATAYGDPGAAPPTPGTFSGSRYGGSRGMRTGSRTGSAPAKSAAAPAATLPDAISILDAWDVRGCYSRGNLLSSVFHQDPNLPGVTWKIVFTRTAVKSLRLDPAGEQVVAGYAYELDPTKTPKTIDLAANGKTVARGIYELGSSRLRLSFGAKRPVSFELLDTGASDTQEDSKEERVRFTLERDRTANTTYVRVDVAADDSLALSVDGRPCTIPAIQEMLRDRAKENPKVRVQLLCPREMPQERVLPVMEQLESLGVKDISTDTYPKQLVVATPARLDLRIAPVRGGEGKPVLGEAEIKRYVEDLQSKGPDSNRKDLGPFAWFPLWGQANPSLITATYRNAQYVLLCTGEAETMLSDDIGELKWGVLRAAATHRESREPRYDIVVRFDDAGARRIAELSQSHIGSPLAILIDDQVIVAPIVRSKLSNEVLITGDFEMGEVMQLSRALNARKATSRVFVPPAAPPAAPPAEPSAAPNVPAPGPSGAPEAGKSPSSETEKTEKPAASGSARLDFRIAPVRGGEGKPVLAEAEIKQYLDQLQAKQPDPKEKVSKPYAWFALPERFGQRTDPAFITATRDNRQYILLCTGEAETMLAADQGVRTWAVTEWTKQATPRGEPMVRVTLDQPGAQRMEKLSEAHIGSPLAILINDRVFNVPFLRTKLSRWVGISGAFSPEETEHLLDALRAAVEAAREKRP